MSTTSKIISGSIRIVGAKGQRKPSRSAIVLTQEAVKRVQNLMKNNPESIGLRIGMKTRGCNGQSYTMTYSMNKERDDEEVVQDGLKIFIERKALMHVLGTEMDFEESDLTSGFVFKNPNIKGTCGCGESFNV